MPEWRRPADNHLIKTSKMKDYELLRLINPRLKDEKDFDDRVYAEYKSQKSSADKFRVAFLLSMAVSLLSLSNSITSIEASGIGIATSYVNHVIFLSSAYSHFFLCSAITKASFGQCWFQEMIEKKSPREKARALLLYPEAFIPVTWLKYNIGYPKDIFPDRSGNIQIIYIILLLISLVFYVGGGASIWAAMIFKIFTSEVPRYISIITICSGIVGIILGVMSPTHNNFHKKYIHYGLSNLLARREGSAKTVAYRKIEAARKRMTKEK